MGPANLKFTHSHEWLRLDGHTATVGITDFAVEALTDLVYVELPEMGTVLAAGEIFGEVESVKAVSDLYAPISGEVIEINTSLPDDLDALSEDPFGRGWMIKLAVTDTSAADHLFDEAGYRDHCNSASH